MAESIKNMNDLLYSVQKRLTDQTIDATPQLHQYLDHLPYIPGQAFYVFNWNEDKISYQRGIAELLGYSDEEFTRELVTSYLHPDDFEIVNRLIRGAVNYMTSNHVTKDDFVINLSCRIKKKNGEYLKVFRQSILFELSDNSRMMSNYTVLSDISFLDLSNKVEWKIEAKEAVKTTIEEHMRAALINFFSERELQVLIHLEAGDSSNQIAEKLFISKNTVDTHRRRMLNKAGCGNTRQLLQFAKYNGFI